MTESFSQLQIAQDLNYISESDVDALRPLYNKVAGLLSGLHRALESRINEK